MTVLIFPDNPVDGQVYPPSAIPGVNQYKWNASTGIWEIVQSGGIFIEKSLIDEKGDLIVGEGNNNPQRLPVGADGEILVADSAEDAGLRWVPQPSLSVETAIFTTGPLSPGQSQDFPLDLGEFFSLISIGISSSPKTSWIRVFTSAAGRTADTRTVPGPPFPSSGSGFAAEVLISSLEPVARFLPAPFIYAVNGLFLRLTNQSLTTQSYTLEVKYLTLVESD